jgi:hypothetical protein
MHMLVNLFFHSLYYTGLLWPVLLTEIPAIRSKYFFPSGEYSQQPEALSISIARGDSEVWARFLKKSLPVG